MIDNKGIADSATVFFVYKEAGDSIEQVKVVTGKEAKTYATVGNASYHATKMVTGKSTVQLAVVYGGIDKEPMPEGTLGKFGYITSSVTINSDGDYLYKVWNGEKTISVTDTSVEKADGLAKGSVITFADLGDNKINKVDRVGTIDTIKGFSDGVLVNFATLNDVKVDKDTKYLNIDSEIASGINGSKLSIAPKDSDGEYMPNALVVMKAGTTNTAELIVVDVTGNGLSQALKDANS